MGEKISQSSIMKQMTHIIVKLEQFSWLTKENDIGWVISTLLNSSFLCVNKLLTEMKEYILDKQLTTKWATEKSKINGFSEEINQISTDLENYIKEGELKDLSKIQKKCINLKLEIVESKVFAKYLLHKDMNKRRLKASKEGENYAQPKVEIQNNETTSEEDSESNESNDTNEENDDNEIRYPYMHKVASSYKLDKIKMKHFKEITKIQKKQEKDKIDYDRKIRLLIDHKGEIEEELIKAKNKLKERYEEKQGVSFDAFNQIYRQLIGEYIDLNPKSSIEFKLNEEKLLNLLKTLSKIKLPEIKYFEINYVPDDCAEVKDFMNNSIQTQTCFYFNFCKQHQLHCNKYLASLKDVALKTTRTICICNMNFSQTEFCEIICASKNVKDVHLREDFLPFDEEFEFGDNLDECRINYLGLFRSGNNNYSNWKGIPHRLNNMLSAIANSPFFHNSLKVLGVGECGINREFSQNALNKYGLDDIELLGV